MRSLHDIYESACEDILIEGQIRKTLKDEQELNKYDALQKINTDIMPKLDITDTMYKYWLKEDPELYLDKTNHLKDTLAIYYKLYTSGKLKNKTLTYTYNGQEITKNLDKPQEFQSFKNFDQVLTKYLNNNEDNLDKINPKNIEMFYVDSDYFVIATKTYNDTQQFIYHAFPNHTYEDNGGYGKDAWNRGKSPYCTSSKGHWDAYARDFDNYTQYWIFWNHQNVTKYLEGRNLTEPQFIKFYNDFKGKAKDGLYGQVDSNLDFLDKFDEQANFKFYMKDFVKKFLSDGNLNLNFQNGVVPYSFIVQYYDDVKLNKHIDLEDLKHALYFKAIRVGDVLTVKKLIEDDPKVALYLNGNGINGTLRSGLHEIAQQKPDMSMKEIADYLLDNTDINVDIIDKDGATPLIVATYYENMQLMRQLMQHGANINAQNLKGSTALMFAVGYGDYEVVEFLVDHGADVTLKNNTGQSAKDMTTKKGILELLYSN